MKPGTSFVLVPLARVEITATLLHLARQLAQLARASLQAQHNEPDLGKRETWDMCQLALALCPGPQQDPGC
eukprot:2204556-Pyramimonas_sp.AAC.1